MNKYELGVKIDQVKQLAARREYREAAKIAKELNWSKVKDWQSLATAINVQEAVGDYEEARDMAILAYNRNLGGRKLIYKLTEFFIKVGDYDNANALYEEYNKVSQHDVSRFILYYDLRRAQGASDNELVGILEDYKDHEIDEKYMYELARLYCKTDRKEECVKTCDNIVLWFQDGKYVEKAVALKEELNAELTSTQKRILEDVKKRKDDTELQKEEMFARTKELVGLKMDEVADAVDEDGQGYATVNEWDVSLKGDDVDEQALVEAAVASSEKADSKDTEYAEAPAIKVPEKPTKEVRLNVPDYDREQEEGPLSMDLVQNNQNNEIKEFIIKALHKGDKAPMSKESSVPFPKAEVPKVERPAVDTAMSEAEETSFSNEVNKANVSLKELIANAKKKLDSNYEKISTEDISVPVPDYSLYDTQNIQAELAANMSDLFEDDDDAADDVGDVLNAAASQSEKVSTRKTADLGEGMAAVKKAVGGEESEEYEDEQIEGQMDIAEWMQSVKEEKYGKQDTKEFSRAELEKYLDEKDEKSRAYEELIAKKKADITVNDGKDDDVEAKRQELEQLILSSVKRDLAIRTGKATARLEQEAEEARAEFIALVTAQIPMVSDNMISDINEIMDEAEEQTAAAEEPEAEELFTRPGRDDAVKQKAAESIMEEAQQDRKEKKSKAVKRPVRRADVDGEESDSNKKLTGELAKIFRKYRDMPGLEEQIYDLFETIKPEMEINTSAVGNILISGNSSSDKTDLARAIVRAINTLYPDQQKKIAKTSGDSINQRGIVKAMSRLKGTALIVEGAGTIQPKRINELLNCLEQDTDRMIVIFEDSDTDMNVLINFNPELTSVFNHRIILKQYTVNELVEMAKRFARKRQYEVDDDALLELYLKIDKLHNANDNIKLDDIKEIISKAIMNSERRASRRFFGGLKKKRGENGDVIFLTESDFKDR